LHVAFVTSEAVPFMKTGGLGDVGTALPKALGQLGHRVTLFLPRYGPIAFPPGPFAGSVHVPVDAVHRSAGFYRRQLWPNVEIVFVEHPPFFDRPFPYGEGNRDYADNRLRFAFLSRAAIEYFRSRGERPDVFHAHDWQGGLAPVYLKSFYWDDPTLHRVPSVFTIHNLAYQGNFAADTIDALGFPWNLADAGALEFHGGVSYLKGGVMFSEMVNTVSPQYAREIQAPQHGFGMDGVLRSRAADLVGILNGVDYDEWDPAVDRFIVRRYSADNMAGKADCKADLLRVFGLPREPDLPLVGIISRLVPQKGFDIVVEAWWDLLQRPMRMIVLGTGDPAVQDGFRALAQRAPERFAVRFAYD
ncbi:MAG TPA: glycogen/starch synthase, partial [Vicinamibacteria bacterium]|nr:glycogen/starch synthase [Vicinamibacteria bacterium]